MIHAKMTLLRLETDPQSSPHLWANSAGRTYRHQSNQPKTACGLGKQLVNEHEIYQHISSQFRKLCIFADSSRADADTTETKTTFYLFTTVRNA